MGITNFPNGVSSFGTPLFGMGGLIPAPGNVYWADGSAGSDGNSGLAPDKALKTLSKAQSLMTANQNDTVIIIANSSAGSSIRESADLAWTKNLTHIVGTAQNVVSQRASLRETSGGTAVVKMMDNSAQGCVFANFHIFQGQSTAEDQFAWDESGERNAYFNLHIAGGGHQTPADRAGSRDILITGGGGEHYFYNCTIGLDTISRGTSAGMTNLELITGTTRNKFENCSFIMHADGATPNFVLVTALGLDRYVWFKDCMFVNAGPATGATTITEGLQIDASPGGVVFMHNSWVIGATTAENATESTNVWNINAGGAATGALAILNTG